MTGAVRFTAESTGNAKKTKEKLCALCALCVLCVKKSANT